MSNGSVGASSPLGDPSGRSVTRERDSDSPCEATGEVWRLVPAHTGDTVDHMRRTDLLVRTVRERGPAVWWHSTATPSILVGPSVAGRIRESAIPIVRRPSGGGAVLVGPGVLGLDVALPASHHLLSGDIVEDYRWIGTVWVEALRRLGIEAESPSRAGIPVWTPTANGLEPEDLALACFGSCGPYEVLANGRKLVGLSQVRRNRGVLFSSAIHVDADPSELAAVLPLSSRRRRSLATFLRAHVANLNAVAGRQIDHRDVMHAFRRSLLELYGIRLRRDRWRSPVEPEQPARSPRSSAAS